MKNKIFIAIILVAVTIIAVSSYFLARGGNRSLQAQVDMSFISIMEDIDDLIKNRDDLATSSNPYDYTKLDAYKTLLKIGPQAVPAIYERMQNNPEKNGLEQYLMAIAIEDLGGFSLREEGYKWGTGSEWQSEFTIFKSTIKNNVLKIYSSDKTIEEKVSELSKYGILALPYLNDKDKEISKRIESELGIPQGTDMQKLKESLKIMIEG